MAQMIRKQIYIEPHQEQLLKKSAAETGMTEAEIVREAIELWSKDEERELHAQEAWKKARAFIEDLIAQGPVEGGRTWKREDLYDR